MLHLNSRHLKVLGAKDRVPFVARISMNADLPAAARATEALLIDALDPTRPPPRGFRAYLLRDEAQGTGQLPETYYALPASLWYLRAGDVIRLSPQQKSLSVLYRMASPSNSLLVTERCNHFCLMCSQPPKEADDSYIVDELLQAIPLFDPNTREVGLTGGEPTLLGARFVELLRTFRNYLPRTSVHVLSNGRRFVDQTFVADVASVRNADLMFGIPIYADVSDIHDFVVQSRGAFDETIRGILNLKRAGVQVEIRFVIHRENYARLPHFAAFIARNLVLVDHVALMGLEPIGFAKANAAQLWIDPVEYQSELADAVQTLARARMRVSVYNHQLCVLSRSLWPFARKSISDWKNEYLPACDGCSSRHECGGFFSSGMLMHSAHIQALA
jgi:His-Xaa-Ser system radical SAM maturase HxsC